MPRSGARRKDNKMVCPHCGQKVKPSNYERHVRARHPEGVQELERERIRRILTGGYG